MDSITLIAGIQYYPGFPLKTVLSGELYPLWSAALAALHYLNLPDESTGYKARNQEHAS